jgi:hypothetical protein
MEVLEALVVQVQQLVQQHQPLEALVCLVVVAVGVLLADHMALMEQMVVLV